MVVGFKKKRRKKSKNGRVDVGCGSPSQLVLVTFAIAGHPSNDRTLPTKFVVLINPLIIGFIGQLSVAPPSLVGGPACN